MLDRRTTHAQHLLGLTSQPHATPWSSEQLATLLEMDAAGEWTSKIADALGKTYGQVRWMRQRVAKLGIEYFIEGDSDPDDDDLTERERTRRRDEAFQSVMMAAIRSGLERAPIGVVCHHGG